MPRNASNDQFVLPIPTQRFTDRAVDYAAARPSYPEQALEAIFDGFDYPDRLSVADLGAGTGISSRLLAERAGRVFAIEPNAAMREHAESAANVMWVNGTAENTTLESASVDLVTAFQAFHWFDPESALREIARVLRPGGRAALIYNERDERDAFTAAYGAIVRRYATDKTEARRGDGRAAFQKYSGWRSVRTTVTANIQRLDHTGIHARVRSTSYLPNDGADAETLHAQIETLFDENAVAGFVAMVMKTMITTGEIAA